MAVPGVRETDRAEGVGALGIVEAGQRVQSAVHLQQRLAKPRWAASFAGAGASAWALLSNSLAQELVPGRLFRCAMGVTCQLEVGEIGGRLRASSRLPNSSTSPSALASRPVQTRPSAAFFRLFRAKAPALAHQADKALIGVFHAQLNGFTHVIRQGTGQPDPHEVGGADAVGVPCTGRAPCRWWRICRTPDGAGEGGGRRRSCPHRRRSSEPPEAA